MKWVASFGHFWYDFIVGDDWSIAATVVVLVALTVWFVDRGWNAWPLLPVGVTAILATSVWREHRKR